MPFFWHGSSILKPLCIVCFMVEMLCFSGYFFGFNGFREVYEKAGVFSHLCVNESNVTELQPFIICDEMKGQHTYALMTWSLFIAISNIPIGFLLDRFGFVVTKFVAIFFFAVSTVLFGFTSNTAPSLLYIAGCCSAISSMSLFTLNVQFARIYPKYSTILVGLVSGSFNSSALIFSVLAVVIQSIALDNHTNVLLVYGVIGTVFLTLTALFIFPNSRQELEGIIHPNKCLIVETNDVHQTLIETTNVSRKTTNGTVDDVLVITPENGDCSHSHKKYEQAGQTNNINEQELLNQLYPSRWCCLKSAYYWYIILFFAPLYLRFNYYFSSLQLNMKRKFDEEAHLYLRHFNYFLFSGILVGPVVGVSVDLLRSMCNHSRLNPLKAYREKGLLAWYHRHTFPMAGGVFLSIIVAYLLTLIDCIASPVATYATFLIFVVLRGCIFSFMVSCIIQSFPIQYYGSLYSILVLISGVFSSLQYVLLTFEHSNWFILRIFFFVLISVSLIYPINMLIDNCCKRIKSQSDPGENVLLNRSI